MALTFTAIIPARYGSSRFPGKPLALINGVPMIIRVWERAKDILEDVYIATDHEEIYNISKRAGAKVIMTSSEHNTGTERVAEAAKKIFTSANSRNQIVLNIQGDEPLISKEAILGLCYSFYSDDVNISTLIHRIKNQEDLNNPNRPKVSIDEENNALIFSRLTVPWDSSQSGPIGGASLFQHIGVYAFRYPILQQLITLPPSPLEQLENLEQLRWLENGYKIRCVLTEYMGFGIDNPDDLLKMNKMFGQA